MTKINGNLKRYSTHLAVSLVILLFLIYSMGTVVVPLIISGIIAISIYPAHKYLTEKGFPGFLSALLLVFILSLIGSTIVFFIAVEGTHIISTIPIDEVPDLIEESSEKLENSIKQSTPLESFDIAKRSQNLLSNLSKALPDLLYNLKDTFVFVITCPLYIFFMLLYNGNFKNAYYSISSGLKEEGRDEILDEIKESYRGYLVGMFWVICVVSALTSLGLWIVGIKYPIFLGVLAGFLTIIPYIGVLISALIPCLLALIMKDSMWSLIGVMAVFAIVQFLEGNIITPKILGDKVNINPLGVIFGLLFLGAIGGVLAMIITVPFLAMLQILAKHNEKWKPLYEMLRT